MFDVDKIRADFPMIKNHPDLVFLDSSATSYKPQCVIDAVNNFYTNNTTNIHRGDYDISYYVSKQYDETREVIKKFINAKEANEIVYTSGATESLNTVAYGYGLTHLKKGDVILTTLQEHASDILPWFDVAKKTGAIIKYIPLNEVGKIDLEGYKNCFKDNNIRIVVLTYVSNVLGYKNPIKEICKIAHEHQAIVSVDGAQAVPHIKVDVTNDDIDFLSFSGHKVLGPSGIGVLYGKMNLLEETSPLMMGGGANSRFDKEGNILLQKVPLKFEAGTPNIEGVLGLKSAIEYINDIGIEKIEAYDKELLTYALNKLKTLNNLIIYNLESDCSIISFNVKGIFAQDVATYLNKNNIAVRSGNHCAKILHNVTGTNESIRASLYLYNTKEDIDKLYDVLKDVTLYKCIGAII